MGTDFTLLRGFLDKSKKGDKDISEVLAEMEVEASGEQFVPEAQEEEENYAPTQDDDNSDDDDTPPPSDDPMSNEPQCARYFKAVDKKDMTPKPAMKRLDIFDEVKWDSTKSEFRFYRNSVNKIIETPDTVKKGHFFDATVKVPNSEVTVAGISYGDWIHSYSTNPPNINVMFWKDSRLGQRYCVADKPCLLSYRIGVEYSVSNYFFHGKGSKMQTPGTLKVSELAKYNSEMGSIDTKSKNRLKSILSNKKIPGLDEKNLKPWVKKLFNWFGWIKDPNGDKKDPCRFEKSYGDKREKFPQGYDLYTSLEVHMGSCRHRAGCFFALATYYNIPCHFVGNDCHAFVEIFVPNVGWLMYNLGGCQPPGSGDEFDSDSAHDSEQDSPPSTPPDEEPDTPTDKSVLQEQVEDLVRRSGFTPDRAKILVKALHKDATIHKRERFF